LFEPDEKNQGENLNIFNEEWSGACYHYARGAPNPPPAHHGRLKSLPYQATQNEPKKDYRLDLFATAIIPQIASTAPNAVNGESGE
jgi:hypothetical protein